MSTLNHKITLYQGGVEATFKLNDEEYKNAKYIADRDDNFNFEWFTWADYDIGQSKRRRFNRLFNYNKGCFHVVELI